MEDLETIPMPGEPVEGIREGDMLESFRNRYRVQTQGSHPQIPTWATFADEIPGFMSDENIFFSSEFLTWDHLYFYSEYDPKPNLYRATPKQVQYFFENRQPWQNRDYYIFDFELTWCIAVTHNDEVIVVGDFPEAIIGISTNEG